MKKLVLALVSLVAVSAFAAPTTTPNDAQPYAACTGSFSPAEMISLYEKGGRWEELTVRTFKRTCNEQSGAKRCQVWEEKVTPRPYRVYGDNSPFPLVTKLVNSSGSVALDIRSEKTTSYKGTGKFTQSAGATSLAVDLIYNQAIEICDDYSYGGGSGSGGCLRSHLSYSDRNWMSLSGAISEDCVALMSDVAVSDEVNFGNGYRSFVETITAIAN